MYICVCKRVNDREFWRAVAEGHDTLPALQCQLGVSTKCGNCRSFVEELLESTPQLQGQAYPLPATP